MIEPVADRLSIPHHRIYANTVLFKEDGTYKGFDPQEPTSRKDGKRREGGREGGREGVERREAKVDESERISP